MRTIMRMLNERNHSDSFPLSKIIPELLKNMEVPASSNESQLSGGDFELSQGVSLNDKTLTITKGHLRKAAEDCLASIADTTNNAKADRIMHPIIEYIDNKRSWSTFAHQVVRVLAIQSQFVSCLLLNLELTCCQLQANYGYVLTSFLISHVDAVSDPETRTHIMQLVSFVLERQNKKAVVSPLAIEQVYSLLRQLISHSEGVSLKEFHKAILECIAVVAKRGQSTTQNTNLITGVLLVLNKCRNQHEISENAILLLLRALLLVCSYNAAVPVGKFYPDSIVKTMSELCVALKPQPREWVMKIFQAMAKGQHNNESGEQESSNKPSSDNKMVTASVSAKQREEFYGALFRSTLLADNKPSNFSEILRTFIVLLQQYKNKDIEYAIPCMFSLAESTSPHLDKLQTLVTAYLYIISQLYNSKEIEKYIEELVAQRIQSNLSCKNFMALLKPYAANEKPVDDQSDELIALFQWNSTGATNTMTPELMIQKERIVEYISGIESLKQTYPNLMDIINKKFPNDFNLFTSFATQQEQSSNSAPDDDVFANDEVSISESNMDGANQVDEEDWKFSNPTQVLKQDFTILGGTSATHTAKTQKVMNDLFLERKAADDTNTASDFDELGDEDEKNEPETGMAEEGAASQTKIRKNSVMILPGDLELLDDSSTLRISIPQMFIFDSLNVIQ